MNQTQRKVQFIPSISRGNGTGHLRRCLEMAAVINDSTRGDTAVSASVALSSGQGKLAAVDAVTEAFPGVPIVRFDQIPSADITVLDGRSNTIAFVEGLKPETTVVGLDEGGRGRDFCDYLIDSFPVVSRQSAPNVFAMAASVPKAKRTSPVDEHKSIVVTFGGEDPAELTPVACRALLRCGVDAERITVVRGSSARAYAGPAGITVLQNPRCLRELLHGFDLVITSFGLTAYEAVASGASVLLVNPSRYHKKLSAAEGFPHAGVRLIRVGKLRRILRNPAGFAFKIQQLKSRLENSGRIADTGGPAATARAIAELSKRLPERCPVCGEVPGKAVARFAGRTYFSCSRSSLVWLAIFDTRRTAYDTSYFFSEYKAQYGKTYLEDFTNIKELSTCRLRWLSKLLPPGSSLIDIGCAYGPFLSAAAEAGLRCYGIDVADDAVKYVRRHLGIAAVKADFLTVDTEKSFQLDKFDCLSMWYVIEHFENLRAVLAKVANLVKPGGVFAFSTPNRAGISGRLAFKKFLNSSPKDHYTIWSPRAARSILREYGFVVKKIRVTGHHPERFPLMAGQRAGLLYELVLAVSRLFKLGDTFEVYAVHAGGVTNAQR